MNFPTMEEAQAASKTQLARWLRFWPGGVTDEQKPIMDYMLDKFYGELGGWTPELSKEIGWEP